MPLFSRSNGRIPQDYHMHSRASCDSQASMAQMCQSALKQGVGEIAFTEHLDYHPKDSCTGFYRPDAYFEQLAAVRHEFEPLGLTIRAGIELSEPHLYHKLQQPVLEAWPYDIVLGSLHWLGDDIVFDGNYFRARSPQAAFAPYFTEMLDMIRHGGFDVLAHMDVFTRTACAIYGPFESADWEDAIRSIWQACIETGIGIEINTGGLRYSGQQPHPALETLRWYHEQGGERLTIGSDSHRPQHVGYELQTALEMARAAGFTRLCSYERREVARWIEIAE